jgi:lysophospholipase L1-like esterase
VRLKNQLKTYKTYWDAQAVKDTPSDAITYIALGDSAAQGIGASKPENGYVGLLASELNAKTNRPVHIVNLSVSGATVNDVTSKQLSQLDTSAVGQAVITLEIGANDVARSYNQSKFTEDVNKLFSVLPKNTIVSDVPSFVKTRLAGKELDAIKANIVLHAAAAKYGFKLVPLYETTNKKNSWRNNAVDLFHPNDSGYKNWYEAFKDQVSDAVVY